MGFRGFRAPLFLPFILFVCFPRVRAQGVFLVEGSGAMAQVVEVGVSYC